jgi:hypothetical protein
MAKVARYIIHYQVVPFRNRFPRSQCFAVCLDFPLPHCSTAIDTLLHSGTSPHHIHICIKISRCTTYACRASSRFCLPEDTTPTQPDSQPHHSRPGRPALRTALAHGSGVPLGRSPSIIRVRKIWEAKLTSQGQGMVTPPIESFTMRSMRLHKG